MAEFESRNKHDIISIIFVVVVKHTSAMKGNYINYVLSLQGYQHHVVRIFYCDEHMAQVFQNWPASHTYIYKSRHILFCFVFHFEQLRCPLGS